MSDTPQVGDVWEIHGHRLKVDESQVVVKCLNMTAFKTTHVLESVLLSNGKLVERDGKAVE